MASSSSSLPVCQSMCSNALLDKDILMTFFIWATPSYSWWPSAHMAAWSPYVSRLYRMHIGWSKLQVWQTQTTRTTHVQSLHTIRVNFLATSNWWWGKPSTQYSNRHSYNLATFCKEGEVVIVINMLALTTLMKTFPQLCDWGFPGGRHGWKHEHNGIKQCHVAPER